MGKIRPPQFSFRSDGCVEAPVLNRIAVTALIHFRTELLGERVASGESSSQSFNKTFIALAPFGLGCWLRGVGQRERARQPEAH
jgi:hypothetical protein